MTTLESLPVELISHILGFLSLGMLITAASLSKRLRDVVGSDCNPWKRPLLENVISGAYEPSLKTLSVRTIVPRSTFLPLLIHGAPKFLLLEFIMPNLAEQDWRQCFTHRFLPGWRNGREDRWRHAFLMTLHRVYHRTHTSCTSEESWTRYITLNRNGSANRLEGTSRSFSPLAIFNEMKLESNLGHLETQVRLVCEFTDVRILALGTLHRPRSQLLVNENARAFLCPPGITIVDRAPSTYHGQARYEALRYPLPATASCNYPYHTPHSDQRLIEGDDEENVRWVGGMMIVAQLVGPRTHEGTVEGHAGLDLLVGPGRNQFVSLSWDDLWTIVPWLRETVSTVIDGPGLTA